ncbi:MAG: hypothetical protein ACYTF3_03465 [Planctomycetota bacterium]|jgi:multidrug efflux pump subunit AcrB
MTLLLILLGFVILAGIVVNNAILIIHQANQNRYAGVELYQGLASVILGGLLLSSLFLVPALVSLGWDVQDLFSRRRPEQA